MPVPVWADSSGNGDNAVKVLSTNQPVYVVNAMNGLPVVRFNAVNSDFLWFYRPMAILTLPSFVSSRVRKVMVRAIYITKAQVW